MQFAVIVAVSAHVGSILLVGWMTVQLHRHLRRIEQRLAALEHAPERVPVAHWPAPAAASNRLGAELPWDTAPSRVGPPLRGRAAAGQPSSD